MYNSPPNMSKEYLIRQQVLIPISLLEALKERAAKNTTTLSAEIRSTLVKSIYAEN